MIKNWPLKLAILILFLTIFPLDYGFYYFGKFVVCAVAIYYCHENYKKEAKEQSKIFWYFLGISILYNPIIPIHLFFRTAWIFIDIVLIIFFLKYLKVIK